MTAGLEGRRLGRYHLMDRLGAGRHGTVYRAHDPYIDRPVAVKVAHRGHGGGRMFVEAQMAASLHHPNITAVYDAGSDDGLDFIVTELVPQHTTAASHLQPGHRPSVEQVLAIVRQCAEALAHAHARGILHRDIKPSNVLIDPSGLSRLTDFGLALPADGEAGGPVCGSSAYLAPEAAAGLGYSEASDLYALGVLLFELLTGRLPFDARSLEDYRAAQAADAARGQGGDQPEALPGVLQRVVDRCLAARPELRYRSASDLVGDLMVVQECLAASQPADLRMEGRAERLAAGSAGLDAAQAAMVARLGDWRRLASGQSLPASETGDCCLVCVVRGTLALRARVMQGEDAPSSERGVAEGCCLMLGPSAVVGLVARSEVELVLLDDARLEKLPALLQQRLLRAAALSGWETPAGCGSPAGRAGG